MSAAARWVRVWCRWYTRGLPGSRAADRRNELDSDLFEQTLSGDEGGSSPRAVALSMLGRAVRGVPADLLWRRAEIRRLAGSEALAFGSWRADRRAANLTVLCGSLMTAWCLFVLVRLCMSADRGDAPVAGAGSALVLGFAAICLCGTLLALRRRTRWVGALWLLAASQVVLHLGLEALLAASATVGRLTWALPGWTAGVVTLSLALGVLCLSSAIWHAPADAPALGADREKVNP